MVSWLQTAAFIVALVAIDQVLKLWVLSSIPFRGNLPVIPGFLYIVHLANTGLIAGIGQQTPGLVPVLALMTVVLLAMIVLLYITYERLARSSAMMRIFLVFSCAPLLCTLIDRIRLGYVVDFVAFRGLPVFNFADLLPEIGIIALLIEIVLFARQSHRSVAVKDSYAQEYHQ